jgi:hypothetical protein
MNTLPIELSREIYSFVDYETKTRCLLGKYPEIIDSSRYLKARFNCSQIRKIHANNVVKCLIDTNSKKNNRSLKKEIHNMFPTIQKSYYIDNFGESIEHKYLHPLYDSLKDLTHGIDKPHELIYVITSFMNMKIGILELDHLFKQLAYKLIASIIYYTKILVEKDRKKELLRKERELKCEILEREKNMKTEQLIIENIERQDMMEEDKLQKKIKKYEQKMEKQMLLAIIAKENKDKRNKLKEQRLQEKQQKEQEKQANKKHREDLKKKKQNEKFLKIVKKIEKKFEKHPIKMFIKVKKYKYI